MGVVIYDQSASVISNINVGLMIIIVSIVIIFVDVLLQVLSSFCVWRSSGLCGGIKLPSPCPRRFELCQCG